jgi:hypothetical protein
MRISNEVDNSFADLYKEILLLSARNLWIGLCMEFFHLEQNT